MCTRPTHSLKSSSRIRRAEQVVCEASSWPGIRTDLCTHVYARTQLHAWGGCFNPGAWCGWWFDGGACTGCTVPPPPFSTGTPLSRVALYTHTQLTTVGQAPPHREQSAPSHNHAHSSLDTPLSCNRHDGAGACCGGPPCFRLPHRAVGPWEAPGQHMCPHSLSGSAFLTASTPIHPTQGSGENCSVTVVLDATDSISTLQCLLAG